MNKTKKYELQDLLLELIYDSQEKGDTSRDNLIKNGLELIRKMKNDSNLNFDGGEINQSLTKLKKSNYIEFYNSNFVLTSAGEKHLEKGANKGELEEANQIRLLAKNQLDAIKQGIKDSKKSIELAEEANKISEKANKKSSQTNWIAIIAIIISLSHLIWEIFLKN